MPISCGSGASASRAIVLEALGQLQYKPPRHYYLYPSSGPLATLPAAEGAMSLTNFEDVAPYNSRPVGGEFAACSTSARSRRDCRSRRRQPGANEYAGWQILTAAVEATKSLDDKQLAGWLERDDRHHRRQARLLGEMAHQHPDQEDLRQIQGGKWFAVWPGHATPGVRCCALTLIAARANRRGRRAVPDAADAVADHGRPHGRCTGCWPWASA